jgi:hypothetical protein
MNPNSISHQLFVAALSPGKSAPEKRPARNAKSVAKQNETAPRPAPSVGEVAQQLNPWSWSGWQHTTI